jgi:excisionase family DNA binding protein
MTAAGSMSTNDAAILLGVSRQTIRRWADIGALPYWRTPGNQRRFERAALDRFVDQRRMRLHILNGGRVDEFSSHGVAD